MQARPQILHSSPHAAGCFAGDGECVRRLRAIDWSATALGDPAGWPPVLRMAVKTAFASAFPMAIHWGPELVTFYNDAFIPLMGNKHPGNLGQPVKLWWAEIWDQVGPVFSMVQQGGSYFVEDALYQPDRGADAPREAFFTHCHSPLWGENGTVEGVLVIATETTDKVLTEQALRATIERHAILLRLTNNIRGLKNPSAIMRTAAETIGGFLAANRAEFAELGNDGTVQYRTGWSDGVLESLGGELSGKQLFGPRILQRMYRGHSAVVSDTGTEALAAGSALAELGVRSCLGVPIVRRGRWVACFHAYCAHARPWTADEVAGAEEVAALAWDAVERAQAQYRLRESETRFRSALDVALLGSFDWDACTDAVIHSERTREIFGFAPGEGHVGADYFRRIVPEDLGRAEKTLECAMAGDGHLQIEYRIRFSGDTTRDIVCMGEGIRHENGRWMRFLGVFNDISERKRAETELRITNERLSLAIEGSGDGVWDWNIQDQSIVFSPRMKAILGFAEDEFVDERQEWMKRIHPEDWQQSDAARQACLDGRLPTFVCEYRVQCKDGRWKWVLVRGIVVARDAQGKPLRMTGMMTDISARKEADEKVWRHANFDALTGLPNRRLFRDRLNLEVAKAQRSGCRIALLFIDLDRFKQVNDLLGHDAGDLLLMQAAQRINGCVRACDTVARLGGDEFTVILGELHSPGHVEHLAQKLLDTLARPFRLNRESAYVSGSIGVAVYPEDGATPEELIRKADQAMYAAKQAGKNQFSYFTPSMDEKAHFHLRLASDLRLALPEHQLQVHYQPVVDLRSGEIVKAEALLRWTHPAIGEIAPASFIPLAEESGLINEIGNWVFREAASFSRHWRRELGKPFQVAVNQSPVQFLAHAQENWLACLAQLNLPGAGVSIDVTEGLLLDASEDIADTLLKYKDCGIQVAVDDFGTGYSSMAYLKKFDIDYLKIDQSFVRDITEDEYNRTIAESIIVMAHKLGMKVIAEGIEKQEQMDTLAAAGCDYGQGYLFSRPVPATEFKRVLADAGRFW